MKGLEYPELAANAWNSRLVMGWLAVETGRVQDARQNQHTHMVALLRWAMNDLFSTMEGAGRWFDQGQVVRFCEACDLVLGSFGWLAKEALDANILRFPLRPKMHALSHLQAQVRSDMRNPKYYARTLDEDFVGVTVRIARKVHRRSVPVATLLRHVIRIKQRWSEAPQTRRRVMPRTRRDRPLKACL